MRTARQRHQCGPVRAQRLAVLAALTGLAGGGTQGDFQEVSPAASRADMHDWLSLDASAGKPTWPSDFPLTEDERALRDLAYPLIEWPYNRHKFYSVAGEYGVIGADHRTDFDVSAYTTHHHNTQQNTNQRHPQRHDAAAAVLRDRLARSRRGRQAAQEPVLRLVSERGRAQKRAAPDRRECLDRRHGAPLAR